MKFSLISLWLSASACGIHGQNVTGMMGRSCGVPVTVRTFELTPDDAGQVTDAIEHINVAFGAELLVQTPTAKEPDVWVIYAQPLHDIDLFSTKGAEAAHTQGMVDLKNGCMGPRVITIVITPKYTTAAFRQSVIRHELLHALGVPHTSWDRTSVMTPGAYYRMADPVPVNGADLAALHAIYR